ncbi:MAG: hypothetical protein ACJ8AT_31465 [Hyalangium sp.]
MKSTAVFSLYNSTRILLWGCTVSAPKDYGCHPVIDGRALAHL